MYSHWAGWCLAPCSRVAQRYKTRRSPPTACWALGLAPGGRTPTNNTITIRTYAPHRHDSILAAVTNTMVTPAQPCGIKFDTKYKTFQSRKFIWGVSSAWNLHRLQLTRGMSSLPGTSTDCSLPGVCVLCLEPPQIAAYLRCVSSSWNLHRLQLTWGMCSLPGTSTDCNLPGVCVLCLEPPQIAAYLGCVSSAWNLHRLQLTWGVCPLPETSTDCSLPGVCVFCLEPPQIAAYLGCVSSAWNLHRLQLTWGGCPLPGTSTDCSLPWVCALCREPPRIPQPHGQRGSSPGHWPGRGADQQPGKPCLQKMEANWGQYKMAAFIQTTFWIWFSWKIRQIWGIW